MNNHKNARTLAEAHNFIPTYSCVLTSNKNKNKIKKVNYLLNARLLLFFLVKQRCVVDWRSVVLFYNWSCRKKKPKAYVHIIDETQQSIFAYSSSLAGRACHSLWSTRHPSFLHIVELEIYLVMILRHSQAWPAYWSTGEKHTAALIFLLKTQSDGP